jgi:hypothetical protein
VLARKAKPQKQRQSAPCITSTSSPAPPHSLPACLPACLPDLTCCTHLNVVAILSTHYGVQGAVAVVLGVADVVLGGAHTLPHCLQRQA